MEDVTRVLHCVALHHLELRLLQSGLTRQGVAPRQFLVDELVLDPLGQHLGDERLAIGPRAGPFDRAGRALLLVDRLNEEVVAGDLAELLIQRTAADLAAVDHCGVGRR